MLVECDFPRLLVASEFSPNATGGGPAVVRQMLKGWPAERLHWWCCLPGADERFGQPVASLRVAAIPPRLYPHHRLARVKSWMLNRLWSPWAARHLRRELREIKPDVVWTIPHAWSIPPLAAVLPGAGVRFHVTMQDYMPTRAGCVRYGAARADRWMELACQLYAQAATRDATSHPMIADLQARTGRAAAQMLHAGLEANDFDFLARALPPGNSEIRIAYAGTIVVEPEFELFVRCVKRVRQQLSRPLTLELWGAHVYRNRPWFDTAWMREHGNLPEPELTQALRACHWGFAPMTLTDDDPQYNHFSFPTKFISYLAAGLPIITVAHPDSSVAKMAAAYQVGVLETVGDEERFSARLREVFSAANPGAGFRPEILRCAREQFDAVRIRAVLHENLRAGATPPRARG